jgi:hypothetical protein
MTHVCSREMTHPWCAVATDPILRRTLGETHSELVS